MFRLRSLQLFQFRNHAQVDLDFPERITAIMGKNGSGKTGILDAIHFLSFTKSYFHHQDAQSVLHGHQGMRIDGRFIVHEEPQLLRLVLRENGKKEITLNQEVVKKFSHHLGRFPVVFIAPDDTELIHGGSELRRRFLDMCISQIDFSYTEFLMMYNKILQQRNACLKTMSHSSSSMDNMLDVYDEQLSQYGQQIFEIRKSSIHILSQYTGLRYDALSNADEDVVLKYQSSLEHEGLLQQLHASRHKDCLLQRTSVGIHKDDLLFELNQRPFKQVASQGQKKSMIFALKWAQHQWLQEQTGKTPMLLLDDLFEKLDAKRSAQLIEWILETEAQVFLTDTHPDRVADALKSSENNWGKIVFS